MTIYRPTAAEIEALTAPSTRAAARSPSRRDLLKGLASGASLALLTALTRRGAAQPSGAAKSGRAPKAKACIVLWLNGGPSQLDSFDPKPKSPNAGKFKAIPTRIKGVQFSEHLGHVADQAHRLAVIRSMSTKEGNHLRARHLVHTGYSPTPTVAHPSLGAWVASRLPNERTALPSFVALGGPSAPAGFLGVQNGPFVVSSIKDPLANVKSQRFVPEKRENERIALLNGLDQRFAAAQHDTKVDGRVSVYGQAVRLMHSDDLSAFDLTTESEKTHQLYGDSDFGRGALMARKLVQGGAKLVEVTLDGFDTHKDGFTRLEKLLGTLDLALSGLLVDLADHKMLDDTLVLCLGEFGRTPKINENEGRDHYPQAWSAVLAGGGIKGGTVHGETDADGVKVDKAVSVPDLLATAMTLLGLDPTESVGTPSGRPISLTDNGSLLRSIVKA
jgi:uncharacterized protein (DUF1501 family)